MAGRRTPKRRVGRAQVQDCVSGLFEEDLHAKRVASLVNGVDGVLHAASLGIRAIGQGLASAQGLAPKQAIKQVDRLLSNTQGSLDTVLACWGRFVVGGRAEIIVNFDWTEFEASDQASDQAMVVLGMQTSHGRSTPLVWQTVTRAALKDQRNAHADARLLRFAAVVPAVVPTEVRVTVVADRGFGDTKLSAWLRDELHVDHVIRFRGVIAVEAEDGESRNARDWVGTSGRMQVLREARVTAARHLVPVVVCVQDRGMQDVWCLASSRSDLSGSAIKAVYGRRFPVEETFRDVRWRKRSAM